MKPHPIPPIVMLLCNSQSTGQPAKSSALPVILQKQPAQLVAALAHEVRNPLANINLAVEMLQSMISDTNQKLYLDIIMRGTWRINEVVTDLLTIGESNEMQTEKHSMQQLLDEVLVVAADRIILKKIIVVKDYDKADRQILVNKQQVKIALTNIIINAIEAMPFEKGQLKLSTRSMKGKCIIEVADNGIGISKEDLKNIFKPRFTNKLSGLGMGLSTTMDILFSNHATVKVASEEGSGTRFIVSFHSTAQKKGA